MMKNWCFEILQQTAKKTRKKLKRTADTKVKDAQQRIKDKAKESLDKYKAHEYQEGDLVRVLETSLYSSARKLLKAGKKK